MLNNFLDSSTEFLTIIRDSRDTLLSAQDTICPERIRLVTQAYQRFEGDPIPVKRAKALRHYLQHMTLDLDSNPLFAGNTSSRPRAWMLLPEYRIQMDPQVALENPEVAHILDNVDCIESTRSFWDSRRYAHAASSPGHLAVDMRRVVHEGLEVLIHEIQQCAGEGTQAQQDYRQGMLIALQAVVEWAGRYAGVAEKAARDEKDPFRRACFERIARACWQVPARPARDLFEGLQAILLVHLATCIEGHGMSVSIGLPDRVLEPFIDQSFAEPRAVEWIAAFMLKISANSYLGRGYLSQTITVGGADARGSDRSNALTLCFLKACDLLRVGEPPLFLRWHPGLNHEVKALAVDMLARGVSMPLLVNDAPTAQGFIRTGLAESDAWEYCVVGCNELAVPGVIAESAWWTSGSLFYVDCLNQSLVDSPRNMDELLDGFETHLAENARQARRSWQEERWRMAAQVPTPFTSALMRGCIARGEDLLTGMQHHPAGLFERGFTNAVNALAVLEQEWDQVERILQAAQNNFPQESLRSRLKDAPKWGNDDARADRWARELLERRERALERIDQEFGQKAHTVCHVVRSLHHVHGAQLPATLDGRKAGAPLADSIGAEVGTAHNGPTAILNSVLKIDAPLFYRGGYNLNLTLAPTRPQEILSLVEVFFGQGGQELQINVFDVAQLRDAQAHPERHGDLLVRIAGLSARFIDLSALEQEELIQRACVV